MIHIFDIDNTVLRKTSAWYFLLEAYSQKKISLSQIRRLPFDYLKYKLARLNNDFIENTVELFAGITRSDIEYVADECFRKRIRPNIYADALRIIEELKSKKENVIFATSSLDFIIRPIEKFFGIEESLASLMEYKDGITTGRLVGNSIFGEKKREAAIKWMEENRINSRDVFFYSDSYSDIPLLEYCGNPVAVNPDRFLLKEAKKRGWKILRFKEVLGPDGKMGSPNETN